jgi:predicted RNase H-like nuclease (RuvC/YqgF family)
MEDRLNIQQINHERNYMYEYILKLKYEIMELHVEVDNLNNQMIDEEDIFLKNEKLNEMNDKIQSKLIEFELKIEMLKRIIV